MSVRLYSYVGPPEIRDAAMSAQPGVLIRTRADLLNWLAANSDDVEQDGTVTATFIIDRAGILCLAPRRSEHVACAAGNPVQSAGEITCSPDGDVLGISNHSTGYCPEPESWSAVGSALDHIPVTHPDGFTTSVVFRLCPKCSNRNIVKDDWFACDICGADLPATWNFPLP